MGADGVAAPRLLGRAGSINVRKALWTADEAGRPLVREDWGSGLRATDTPEFRALNPDALVPVRVDGDFVLWESNAICRSIAARQGRTDLLPAEPAARARVEPWMDRQATELNNAWRYAFMALVRRKPEPADPQAVAAGTAGWNRHMAMIDAQRARTGAVAAGATFTLAGVVLGLATHRWMAKPIERPRLPAVEAYDQRPSERRAFMRHGCNGQP